MTAPTIETIPAPHLDNEPEPLYVQPDMASTNFYWTFGKSETFNLQTTFRGNPQAVEIEAHLAAVKSALVHIVEMGGHAKPVGQQASYQTPKPTPQLRPADNTAANLEAAGRAVPKPDAEPKPATTNGEKQILKLAVSKVEIVPKPDGKAELKFYGAGHKYPDLYATRSIAVWAEEIGWDVSAFAAAITYDTTDVGKSPTMEVGYTLSDKLNTKGNPYKDIDYIKMA